MTSIRQNEEGNPKQKTVLVIEDDTCNAEMLTLMLQQETPYSVISLTEDLEPTYLIRRVREIDPALLLLDYRLPRTTGLELYDRLQAIQELQHIPTIVITAGIERDQQEELEKRKIPLIYKPFEMDDFLRSIEEIIE
ncbi:two-component system phosphate regulon response regulator PhoB [Thermosporothrix hazakensis]|jgi:CheY-like chemotaxis protein|uniref:Two-component system phosphate regulon response regulator PhoB n=2 Tax=Thermosporothrix TaxID=768650 RepID=A0A326UBK3_THEHA|nr:response regulator [Thermosporothrix hazakensis]PZW22446.1 two-component system phosphate regulon response regulator PhoB [Thermosporothrix hazakensis]BBH86071.1 response regulator [Thermosporothrix sp. COM3]GCE45504.1 response regulator [Thermosporothrix hazakensis]